jgi:aspartate aminotransferase-like enzyme
MREDVDNSLELRDYLLQRHGVLVATAMGEFARNVLRIGHMGKAGSRDYIVPCLLGVEDFVRTVKRQDIPQGISLVGLSQPGWY